VELVLCLGMVNIQRASDYSGPYQSVIFEYIYLFWLILTTVQWDETQSSLFIILQVHSTCFGCQLHPSSVVHKTVSTVTGTGHAATFVQRGQVKMWPRWREVTVQKIWPIPEVVVTVLCTTDDGCDWDPKHLEWTCRIINILLCFASCWRVINTSGVPGILFRGGGGILKNSVWDEGKRGLWGGAP